MNFRRIPLVRRARVFLGLCKVVPRYAWLLGLDWIPGIEGTGAA